MGKLKQLQKRELIPTHKKNKLEEKIDILANELHDLLKINTPLVEELLNNLLPAISLRNLDINKLDEIIEFKKIQTINEKVRKEKKPLHIETKTEPPATFKYKPRKDNLLTLNDILHC